MTIFANCCSTLTYDSARYGFAARPNPEIDDSVSPTLKVRRRLCDDNGLSSDKCNTVLSKDTSQENDGFTRVGVQSVKLRRPLAVTAP